MKYIEYFYNYNAKEKFQLEVNITGIDYLTKEDSSCLERGLDNYISNLFFNDLTDVVRRIFEYLNNCEIPKKDFDLTITLVELKNAISTKDEDGNESLKVYLDEQNCPYKKEAVNYKKGEFQSYLFYDNTDGVKQFDYSNVKSFIILDNPNEDVQCFTNEIFEKIERLKKGIPYLLTNNEEKLITAYECFYDESFGQKDGFIKWKMRYMMFLLETFDIKFGCDELFSGYSTCASPNLYLVGDWFQKILEASVIERNNSADKLSKSEKSKILNIGKIVREHISAYFNPKEEIEELDTLCRMVQYQSFSINLGDKNRSADEQLRLIRIKKMRDIANNNAKN